MEHIIRSALWEEKPYVVKAPESLFTIKDHAGEPAADGQAEPQQDQEVQRMALEHSIKQAEEQIKRLQAQADGILSQAKVESDKIIADAHEEAEEIKNASLEEAKEMLDKEQQKGHTEGVEQGKAAAAEEMQAAIAAANEKAQRIVAAAEQDSATCLARSQDKIVDMVVDIAQKVLQQKFEEMPQLALRLLQNALDKVKDQPEVTVKVSANAYEFALLAKSELQGHLAGNAVLKIVADDTLAEGDCWVETPNGDVDSGYTSQLKVIEKALREAVQKGESM